MDVPLLIHDDLLHQLDEPLAQHLRQTLKSAAATNGIERNKILLAKTDELMALILLKDSLVVDFDQVEAILDAEEQEAVLFVAELQTWDIIKAETAALVAIAVPMFLFVTLESVPSVLICMMVSFTDKARSTQILAGFNLEGVFEMLLITGMTDGFVAGVDTLCTQAFGGKRFVEMWLFCQAGLLGYLVTLPFVLLALFFGSPILQALGQDPAIAAIAGKILMVLAVGYPIGVILSLVRSALQAQNVVMPLVVTSFVSWTLTLSIAYLLAFHTSLGYMGFAIASPLCWFFKALMLTPVLLRNKVFVQSWPGWQFNQALMLLPKVAKLGVSGLLMVTFQMLGVSVVMLISGMLPNADISIAINGILGSLVSLILLPFMAFSTAGAIRIGNSLGAGQARRAKAISQIVIAACLVVSTLLALAVPLFANSFARLSTPNQAAITAATVVMKQVLPIIPLFSLSFALQATFRACGRQLMWAVVNFICSFLIGVPLGVLLGFKWGFDLVGLWYGSEVGLVLTIATGLVWFVCVNWTQLAHEAKHNMKVQDCATAAAAY